MDGTIEPLLVVIGDPIVGNPTQFAIERALAHLKLEWRVVSFNVPSEKVAIALDGLDALGVAGIAVDRSLGAAAAQWTDANESFIDGLVRNPTGDWATGYETAGWIAEVLDSSPGKRYWLGPWDETLGLDKNRFEKVYRRVPMDPAVLADADLIATTVDGLDPTDLAAIGFGAASPVTVLDLTDGPPVLETVTIDNAVWLSPVDRLCNKLRRWLARWTDHDVPPDVLTEAIEEYLAV